MAKSIKATKKDIEKYQTLTEILGLEDLLIVKKERDESNGSNLLFCVPKWPVGICPDCGVFTQKIHDYPEQRTIHDAPLRGVKTMLIFDVHRLYCDTCEHVFTLAIRDIVADCTYTHRLATMIADPSRKQDIQTLATIYEIGYKVVESILHKAAENKLRSRISEPVKVTHLGIDEQSNRKGKGHYILVLTDLEKRIVLDVLPDREKKSLIEWLEKPPAGIDLSHLQTVAIDLWKNYRDGVAHVFGQKVKVVADRFHVMQNLHEAIHKVRKQAQQDAKTEEEQKTLKGLRYLLLKKDARLTDREKERLNKLKKSHPSLYQLTRLRQQLYEWYEQTLTVEDATIQLDQWLHDASCLKLEPLDRFCKTLRNWRCEIVNFFLIASPVVSLRG